MNSTRMHAPQGGSSPIARQPETGTPSSRRFTSPPSGQATVSRPSSPTRVPQAINAKNDVHIEGNAFETLIPQLQSALKEAGYTVPTPVQARCIPDLIAGRDLLGCAQTGTGKTAAFTLPLLQRLHAQPRRLTPRKPRVLILAPTRELAAQIGDSIATYGKNLHIEHTVIFGGVGQNPQERAMNRGVDILVATPGRLLDLMQQRFVNLDSIEAFVLDEADRMLDLGFIHDVRKVIARLPAHRQSLFFSATLPPEVVSLANTLLRNPVRVTVTPEQPTVERIDQRVLFVDKPRKDALLASILDEPSMDKVIVFVQRKRVADAVTKKLATVGITASAIHGNKSQNARTAALEGFRSGRVRVLVATDIAARGIDVDGISHVINYELPNEPETYVHRIGRTARAGARGDALSFCSASERDQWRDIERLIRRSVPVDRDHHSHSMEAESATGQAARAPARAQRPQRPQRAQRSQRSGNASGTPRQQGQASGTSAKGARTGAFRPSGSNRRRN